MFGIIAVHADDDGLEAAGGNDFIDNRFGDVDGNGKTDAFALGGLYGELINVINGTSNKGYSSVYASLEDKLNTELTDLLVHFY